MRATIHLPEAATELRMEDFLAYKQVYDPSVLAVPRNTTVMDVRLHAGADP